MSEPKTKQKIEERFQKAFPLLFRYFVVDKTLHIWRYRRFKADFFACNWVDEDHPAAVERLTVYQLKRAAV